MELIFKIHISACVWNSWINREYFSLMNQIASTSCTSHVVMNYCSIWISSSLDNIYKKTGPIPEHVLGKITVAVVSGLNYLYDSHRIIHRGELTLRLYEKFHETYTISHAFPEH
jgi:hypothetical protein